MATTTTTTKTKTNNTTNTTLIPPGKQQQKNHSSSKQRKPPRSFVPVCAPEQETGCVEYKRQVVSTALLAEWSSSTNEEEEEETVSRSHATPWFTTPTTTTPTTTTAASNYIRRLQSLATQMAYRLHCGSGGAAPNHWNGGGGGSCGCWYQVGVEDDGCHSGLPYMPDIVVSCLVLEYLARRFHNAVTTQRLMIQHELPPNGVVRDTDDDNDDNDNDDNDNDDDGSQTNQQQQQQQASSSSPVVCFEEPSIWDEWDAHHQNHPPMTTTTTTTSTTNDTSVVWIPRPPPPPSPPPQSTSSTTTTTTTPTRAQLHFTQLEPQVGTLTYPPEWASLEYFVHVVLPRYYRQLVLLQQQEQETTQQPQQQSEQEQDSRIRRQQVPDNSNGNDTLRNNHPEEEAEEEEEPTITTTTTIPVTTTAPRFPAAQPPAATTTNHHTVQTNAIGETLALRNIRLAVLGPADAGKSTLIGTLTTGCWDDGRGKTRTFVMKHRHEIETGRTSTATCHLMGFQSNGRVVGSGVEEEDDDDYHLNDSHRQQLQQQRRRRRRTRMTTMMTAPQSQEEIVKQAHKVVTLMDLAGHEKFLKTTIHGVSSGFADYALVLVNSRQQQPQSPSNTMTRHHVNLCRSFNIPIILVLTKIDGCPKHVLQKCQDQVTRMLHIKRPLHIRTVQDVAKAVETLTNTTGSSSSSSGSTMTPMIQISSVTGEGIDLLQQLFFSLPKRRRHASHKIGRNFEFLVDDVFDLPNVGPVVSGFVNAGELRVDVGAAAAMATAGGVGDLVPVTTSMSLPPPMTMITRHRGRNRGTAVHVGPLNDGSFVATTAVSAQIARIPTTHIIAGQSVTLALDPNTVQCHQLRRGMVVVAAPAAARDDVVPLSSSSSDNNHKYNTTLLSTKQFNAEICVVPTTKNNNHKATKIREVFVHVLNVRQLAVVRHVEIIQPHPSCHRDPSLQHSSNNHPRNDNDESNNENHHPEQDSTKALPEPEQQNNNDTNNTGGDFEETENTTVNNNKSTNNNNRDDETALMLAPGSRAKVCFEFLQRPEYVRPGMRLMFRNGQVRGVGLVTSIPPSSTHNNNNTKET